MRKIFLICMIILVFVSIFHTNAQIKSINLVVSLTGSIINHDTKDYATIRYELVDTAGKKVARGRSNALQKGYYFITGLKPGHTYYIRFLDMSYLRIEYKITIPYTDKYTEYSKDFLVIPRKQNLKLYLAVPPFERGKTKLRYGIEDYLDFYAKIITRNPRIKFEVQCFPDKIDKPENNLKLTTGRVSSLKNYFLEKGAKEEKVKTKGFTYIDPDKPLSKKKRSKGKRYIGSTYVVIFRLK